MILFHALLEQSAGRRRFVFAAGLITLILGITRIVVETLQAIQLRADYFSDWVNWMEIIMVIFSFIFIWVFNTECLCPTRWQWQFGTIAVFLAWTDFIIFVQKLPGIGIYVVMLIDILWIFVKTVPLTIMLVIAFGLGLFMAFFEPQVTVSCLDYMHVHLRSEFEYKGCMLFVVFHLPLYY